MLENIYRLDGKVIVITGAAGLLGRKHAEAIACYGGTPILLDLSEQTVNKLADELNNKYNIGSIGFAIDITNEEQIIDFKKKFLKKYKKLNILINHAHYKGNPKKLDPNNNFFSKLEVYPTEEWNKTIDVNLNGMFFLTKHFIDLLEKNKNSVILNT